MSEFFSIIIVYMFACVCVRLLAFQVVSKVGAGALDLFLDSDQIYSVPMTPVGLNYRPVIFTLKVHDAEVHSP